MHTERVGRPVALRVSKEHCLQTASLYKEWRHGLTGVAEPSLVDG